MWQTLYIFKALSNILHETKCKIILHNSNLSLSFHYLLVAGEDMTASSPWSYTQSEPLFLSTPEYFKRGGRVNPPGAVLSAPLFSSVPNATPAFLCCSERLKPHRGKLLPIPSIPFFLSPSKVNSHPFYTNITFSHSHISRYSWHQNEYFTSSTFLHTILTK